MKQILTAGLPRSGKSTWAKKQGLPIVSPDAIRLAMHGHRFIPEAEPWIWTMAVTMRDALFLAGNEIVIIDATNTTEKRREKWFSPGIDTELKIFDTDPKTCIRRAIDTGQSDLIPVIERMADDWDLPFSFAQTVG